MKTDFDALAKDIHSRNRNWWVDLKTGKRLRRNKGEMLMLVVTELAEAVEGIRKNLMDDHLPHRRMEEVEIADAVIRLLDFAGGFGISLNKAETLISEVERKYTVIRQSNKAAQILRICGEICDSNENVLGAWSRGYHIMIALLMIQSYCRLNPVYGDGSRIES